MGRTTVEGGTDVQGHDQRDDVPRLLAAADIFCQPNLGPEPFGIGFVEALSAGLPVITTATGGALEIVDGDCGIRSGLASAPIGFPVMGS